MRPALRAARRSAATAVTSCCPRQAALARRARWYTTGDEGMQVVFDKGKKLAQRSAAAQRPDAAEFDYLRDEIASRLVDRLNDITRTFPVALDLGANTGNLAKQLEATGAGGIGRLYMMEECREMLYRDSETWRKYEKLKDIVPLPWARRPGASEGDDAPAIPLPDGSVDLVLSSLSLHWVNNIPGLLSEVLRVLRPDGVFLAGLLGGESLAELRSAWVAAESERDGGVSPHVSPMMGVADAGNLLTAAGFGIPTVDSDIFTIEYPSPVAVMEHLQAMGEASAALGARPGARPGTVLAAAAAYQAMYGNNAPPPAGDGSVPATFEVVYMIGWKPAPTQPSPLARGSVPKGFAARVVEPAPGAAASGSGGTPPQPLR